MNRPRGRLNLAAEGRPPKPRRFAASERSESRRLANRLRAWGPAAVWAAVLFLLSAWPDPQIGSFFRGADKVAHVGLYSVLGAGLANGRRRAGARVPHWVLVGVGALYGATDEWHQAFVRGRTADWADWLADVTGVVLGYTALMIFFGWLSRRRDRSPGDT